MSEMIERVARVLCARNGEPEDCLKFYRDDARAAIEAMREPTQAMLDVAVNCIGIELDREWRDMIDEALK